MKPDTYRKHQRRRTKLFLPGCTCTTWECVIKKEFIKFCIQLIMANATNMCWYRTDFSVQSRVRDRSFGSCGSTVPVLVPQFWFLLLDTRVLVKRFSGFFFVCLILVLVGLHFDCILARNQLKLKLSY